MIYWNERMKLSKFAYSIRWQCSSIGIFMERMYGARVCMGDSFSE